MQALPGDTARTSASLTASAAWPLTPLTPLAVCAALATRAELAACAAWLTLRNTSSMVVTDRP